MALTQVSSGGLVLAVDMNNALSKRVGESVLTVNSVGTSGTTVLTINSITVSLIAGQTYALRWTGRIAHSVGSQIAQIKVRPNNSLGTEYSVQQLYIPTADAGGFAVDYYNEFTAPSNATYTFVATLAVPSGSGSATIKSSTTGPSYLTCDYVGV